MKNLKKIFQGLFSLFFIGLALIILECCNEQKNKESQKNGIEITINKKRFKPGDTVTFNIAYNFKKRPDSIGVYLVKPTKGTEKLTVEKNTENKNEYHGKIILGNDIPDGLYVITAIASNGSEKAVGKSSFLSGNIILDYVLMLNFSDSMAVSDMENYINAFLKIGGNALCLHANISTEKVWGGTTIAKAVWASKVCKNAVSEQNDKIEMMLKLTDKLGIPSIISIEYDCTDSTLINTGFMKSIYDITNE